MEETVMIRALVGERVKVLGYIQSLVRRRDLAEDVFQDVCVLAVEKRHAIQDEAHLMNWLRTTARLTALNLLRKRQERQLVFGDNLLELLDVQWQEHDTDSSAAMANALRLCMESLSEKSRDLIHRRYSAGESYTTLANSLHRPVGSLYVTFSRIHNALAECMTHRLGTEGGTHV
jgi:RNA polymerase sigma-70 factor, ECF subfamily